MKHLILLAEDNETLGYILKEYLEMNDFQVVWARNGKQAWEKFSQNVFDLCILDVMMPEQDGFALAEQIKNVDIGMPLIFLTAKSLKIDKLKGFKLGADDYIIKPIDEEELVARIQAVLKRSKNNLSNKPMEAFCIGKYTFDYNSQSLHYQDFTQTISKKEAEVLKMLCQQKNQVLQRDETLKKIWGTNDYFARRSMDVFISKLRKYLSQDIDIQIVNIHNRGFMLVAQ